MRSRVSSTEGLGIIYRLAGEVGGGGGGGANRSRF